MKELGSDTGIEICSKHRQFFRIRARLFQLVLTQIIVEVRLTIVTENETSRDSVSAPMAMPNEPLKYKLFINNKTNKFFP